MKHQKPNPIYKEEGGCRGVEFQGTTRKQNTPAQDDVLRMLTLEYLTPRQIAYRRRTGITAVYNIIAKLKKKGLLEGSMGKAWKRVEVTPQGGGLNFPYRLHAERWHLVLSKRGTRYRRLRHTKKRIQLDSNTVLMHPDTMEVYSHMSFYGKSQQEAEEKASAYCRVFFKGLSERLGASWTRVMRNGAHYAYMNSEIADDARARSERYCVLGKDGKTWLITDDSFKCMEDETIHPQDAAKDRATLDRWLNDIRNNPKSLIPSETTKLIAALITKHESFTKEIRETLAPLTDINNNDSERFRPDYFQ